MIVGGVLTVENMLSHLWQYTKASSYRRAVWGSFWIDIKMCKFIDETSLSEERL